MEFEPGLDEVAVPELDAEFLAEGQVAHRPLPVEGDRGEQILFVGFLNVYDPVLGVDVGLEVQELRVPVPRQDGRRRHPLREEGVQAHGPQVVRDIAQEVHASFVFPVLGFKGEIRVLPAADAQERQAMPRTELPVRLDLKVCERGKILIQDAADHHVVVGPAGRCEPGATTRKRSFENEVSIRDAQRRGALEIAAPGAVANHQQRREPVAVLGPEPAGHQREIGDRLRVEGADQSKEPVGVVDLHPVHQGQVLVGSPASHRKEASEVRGGRHPGKGRQRAEDVVHGAGSLENLLGRHPGRRRTVQHRRLGRHLHGLFFEGPWQEFDDGFPGFTREHGGFEIVVRQHLEHPRTITGR